MKKLLSIFIIVLYFPSIFARFLDGESQLFVIIISMIIAFILACLNITYAILGTKSLRTDPQKQQSVNRTILIVKLALIPFFIINFSIWAVFFGMFLLTPGGIIIDIILVPMGIGFTYVILLATSTYSISLLFTLYKNSILTRKQFILHSVFQLIFVADVIDQIVIKKFTKIS